MRIAIAGAGKVGLSLADELAHNGHDVLLIDREPKVADIAITGVTPLQLAPVATTAIVTVAVFVSTVAVIVAPVALGIENREALEEVPLDNEMAQFLGEFPSATVRYWHDTGHAQIKEHLGFLHHVTHLGQLADRLGGFHLHDVEFPGSDHREPGTGSVDFAALKPFDQRKGPGLSVFDALKEANIAFTQISAANVFAFNLPPIMGLGNSSGFEFQIESLGGAPPSELAQVARGMMLAAQSVPERMAIISAGVIMNVIFAVLMASWALGLGVKEMTLLTNSKKSIVGLEGFGLKVVGQKPVPGRPVQRKQ